MTDLKPGEIEYLCGGEYIIRNDEDWILIDEGPDYKTFKKVR